MFVISETPCLCIDDIFFLKPEVSRTKVRRSEDWREKMFIYAKRLSVQSAAQDGRIAGRRF